MLKQLEVNIHKNGLFNKTHRLLVAFSGGVDSVVLCDLLQQAGYDFAMAHCNFQLRGQEANDDTRFCENYALSIHKTSHVKLFDTAAYAKEQKLSMQMAARELRYNWFKELCHEHHYDLVLTAHHANDNLETLLVNLVRGTGIKGLQGIPEKQRQTVRPLLFATKDDILHYAQKQQLAYREDSSNREVKYKRNFIRHNIIPELKNLNPALEETIADSIQFFKQANAIVKAFAAEKHNSICSEKNGQLLIDIFLLLHEPQKETLLFEWLHGKKFKPHQIRQLGEALLHEDSTGKQFSSKTHQLVIDRKYIIVQSLEQKPADAQFTITSVTDTEHLPIKLSFTHLQKAEFSSNSNEITISFTEHLFPLTLRRWKQGDKFRPFGMKGFKKLSDFFKDRKLSLFEKEQVWILENKQHIIWIVGYRMDDRCKVTEDSQEFLRVSLSLS